MVFIPYKKSLRVVIVPPIEEAHGCLKGMDTNVWRDGEESV
jgi:hypothetical protein